jgi:TfoX/Sxy family transcriptional regulator of competence genes
MASDLSFVEYACEQMSQAGTITFRKMFGEYAVYCDGKVVALVCDNRLYVKPTSGGREVAGQLSEAPPYPGAKPYLLVGEELDDRVSMSDLIRITASEVPLPKERRKKVR